MTIRICITAGGTGGHIFPAMAMADRFCERGYAVTWLGSTGGMEEQLVLQHGLPFQGLNFKGVRGKGILHTFRGLINMGSAIYQAIQHLKRERPHLLVAFGGYPTFPALVAARILHIPIVLHEANRVLGLANRVAAPWAARIATTFPKTFVKQPASKVVHTGAPLRSVFESAELPAERYRLREGKLRVLVVGGSQGASILNRLVPEALALLPEALRPEVTHQSGAKHIETLKEEYRQQGVAAHTVAFIEDMRTAYLDADVVICRAGALTVAETLAMGVPAVYVPLPTAKDQPANAKWCEDQQVGWCFPQAELTAASLAQWIQSCQREALEKVASRAYQLGLRDGTARLAAVCESVIAEIKNESMKEK